MRLVNHDALDGLRPSCAVRDGEKPVIFRPQKIDLIFGTIGFLNIGLQRRRPTPPVRAAAFDVTTILAPAARSSTLILSPIEIITPSMAVATAEPSAIAAMISALRLGERRMESRTKRTIMRGRRI